MKARTIVLVVVVWLVGASAVCFAADSPQMGTWILNEAKSKFDPGAPKNRTVVYTAAGDSIKVTVAGVDASGAATQNEWTGKWDGKDYPVTGDPTGDMRAYTKVNEHTLTFANKKGGKITLTGRITVSADGKTRTVTTSSTDAAGKKVTSTGVYDKQ